MHLSPTNKGGLCSRIFLGIISFWGICPTGQALQINEDPALGSSVYGRFTANGSPNPNFLFAGLDFSGVAKYGEVTMLTPQHFITAWHAAPSVGSVIRFANRDNVEKSYVIGGFLDLGLSDMAIGYFTQPIPDADKVSHYAVVKGDRPGNDYSWFLQPGHQYIIGGNNGFAMLTEPHIYPPPVVATFGWGWTINGQYHTAYAQGGDSGKPVMLVYNNKLTAIGANWGPSHCTFLPYHIAKINQVMAANPTGGAYQLTLVDPFSSPSVTWTGTESNVWSTTADNWSTGPWTNAGQGAVFNTGGTAVLLSGSVFAHSLALSQGATGFTFSSQELNLYGGGILANESVTFSGPIKTSLFQSWTVASGKNLVASGPLNLYLSTLTLEGEGNTTINGVIRDLRSDPMFVGPKPASGGNLIKKGLGQLTLNAANTLTGTFRPVEGPVVLQHADALKTAIIQLEAVDTGTISSPAAPNLSLGALSGNRNLASAMSGAVFTKLTLAGSVLPESTYAGSITNIQNLEKVGSGLQLFTGSNTIPGGTVIKEGLLGITKLASIGGSGASVTFAGGGLQIRGAELSNLDGLNLIASPGIPLWFDLPVYDTPEIYRNTVINQSLQAEGFIKSGWASLALAGNNSFGASGISIESGELILLNTNSNSGSILVDTGSLLINSSSALGPANTPISIQNGGNLKIWGTNLHNLDTHPGIWVNFNGSVEVQDPANTFTIGGSLTGSGAFFKRGAGLLVLSASSTLSGLTTLLEGSMRLDHPDALQNSTLEIRPYTQLLFGSVTQVRVGGLTGVFSGLDGGPAPQALTNIVNQGVELIVGGANNGLQVYDGDFEGLGSLTKTGSGILELSGAMSYAGGTKVEGGTLHLLPSSTLQGDVKVGAAGQFSVDVAANATCASRVPASRLSGSGALSGQAAIIGGTNSTGAQQSVNLNWRSRVVSELPKLASEVFAPSTYPAGTWSGVYGMDGYNIIGAGASYPSYVAVGATGKSDYTWASSTTDFRALKKPSSSARIASSWYSSNAFTLSLNFSDAQMHKVSLYFLDWDSNTRVQKIEVINATNQAVLDTQTISSFQGGRYLSWVLSGNINIRITNMRGATNNAVLNGIFFDSTTAKPSSSPYVVSMGYQPGVVGGEEGELRLLTNSATGWKEAVQDNKSGTSQFLNRAYNPATDFAVGKHGVDLANNTVWAVLDYSGELAAGNLNPPAQVSFSSWIGSGGYNLSGTNALPETDPDGDNVVNLMEYALGSDPTLASSAVLPDLGVTTFSGADYLTLTFRRRIVPSGITYLPQSSSDLATWPGTPVLFGTPILLGDGVFEQVTYRDDEPFAGDLKRFLRLQVTQP